MSGSASNPGQMAGVACGSYAPHTYLKNKCRDCGHPEAEHPAKPAAADGSGAGADWQSAAAAAGAAPGQSGQQTDAVAFVCCVVVLCVRLTGCVCTFCPGRVPAFPFCLQMWRPSNSCLWLTQAH
jgi:hypothetical protein